MKKLMYLLATLSVLLASCKLTDGVNDDPDSTDKAGVFTITGTVVDFTTGTPLEGVYVEFITSGSRKGVLTNASGSYTHKDSTNAGLQVRIIANKTGYDGDTTSVFVSAGKSSTASPLILKAKSTVVVTPGRPASIYLVSTTTSIIGVKGSGSIETAQLVYELQDSSGKAIDLSRSVPVTFKLGANPGGGVQFSPNTAKSDAAGRVTVNVNAGTIAGVVQVFAEAVDSGRIVTSKPVAITIHGGLPEQSHFSIAPSKLNIPGYNIFGVEDIITAYVGDKYGNPCKPQSAVYFTSTGGIIEGSGLTNLLGQTSVRLTSSEPRPEHPILGKGFATITASTADENLQNIYADCLVLFSGVPFISVVPSSFDLPNGATQMFDYIVSDQHGNPLSSGQSVSVRVDGQDIEAKGDVTMQIPDTQSKGWTQFSFSLRETADTTLVPRSISITISTTGPNGSAKLTFGGTTR